MGDVGDYWREHREYKREQKEKQQPFNDRWVEELRKIADVRELSSNGPHLRVNGCLDWWPSTRMQQALTGADAAAVSAAKKAIKKARRRVFARQAGGQS